MLSYTPKLRATTQLTYLPSSIFDSSLSCSVNPFELKDARKKIEIKDSFLSQTLKSSIISDCDYNSSIYEWRKSQIAPIIKVIQVARTSEIDSLTGFSCIRNTIKPQPISCSLSHYRQFSKGQMLYVLKSLLDGHQAIFKKMNATSVSLEKSVITAKGEVKVWVNQQFQRNDISGQILTKQQDIVRRIFQTVIFLANSNAKIRFNDFLQYVDSAMKKTGKWTFISLKAMLKSYSDCLRVKIPKKIKLDENKREVLSSMIENNQNIYNLAGRPRLNSFQATNRNIQSTFIYQNQTRRFSLLSSKNSLKQSNQFSSNILQSLSKNPTSKSIEQKQTSSTIRSLGKRNKHTSSISALLKQKDPIIEVFKDKSKQFKSGLLDARYSPKINEHRKIPSINQILSRKNHIFPLLQLQQDEQSNSSPSARKNDIQQIDEKQNYLAVKPLYLKVEQTAKPSKQSSISTTNQTSVSGFQFCFTKKAKDSHLTINLDENSKMEEFRTASRDRFKDHPGSYKTAEPKKAVGSCTNWSNQSNINAFNLTNLLQEVHYSKIIDPPESNHQNKNQQSLKQQIVNNTSKLEAKKQLISFKNVENEQQSKQAVTPNKGYNKLMRHLIKNPLTLLNQLRSEQQLESFQNTQKNSSYGSSQSPSIRKIRVPLQQKILELLNLNKKLVVSTYMQTNSEKKIKSQQTPDKQKQKKLREIEQTLSQLVRANLKQQEILDGNCWTKKLQNLLGIQEDEMKESISFGPEQANALLRQIKLSRLGKWGRDIGQSVIPAE